MLRGFKISSGNFRNKVKSILKVGAAFVFGSRNGRKVFLFRCWRAARLTGRKSTGIFRGAFCLAQVFRLTEIAEGGGGVAPLLGLLSSTQFFTIHITLSRNTTPDRPTAFYHSSPCIPELLLRTPRKWRAVAQQWVCSILSVHIRDPLERLQGLFVEHR